MIKQVTNDKQSGANNEVKPSVVAASLVYQGPQVFNSLPMTVGWSLAVK